MQTDSEIERDIEDELRWDPSLENDDIAVSVRDGVVTLAGFAKSYLDKWHAERVAILTSRAPRSMRSNGTLRFQWVASR